MLKIDGRELGKHSNIEFDLNLGAIMGLNEGRIEGVKGDAAIIRISPVAGQHFGRVLKIVELRPAVIKVALGIARMNLAEKFGSEWLEDKFGRAKLEAKTAWDAAFNSPACVKLGTEVDDRNGRKYSVIFLSEPTGKEVDGYLTVTMMTTGTGIGAYSYRADYPGSYMRKAAVKGTGDVMHFAMLTFSKADAPVMIIERVFADEEMMMTDYTMKLGRSVVQRTFTQTEAAIWLVGEPDNTSEEEDEDVITEHTIINFATELGLTAEQVQSAIEAGCDTVEILATRKATDGDAGELRISKSTLSKAIRAAKKILGK
jgi:hypothetical protein